MKELNIITKVEILLESELTTEEKSLIQKAKDATEKSYSPYSNFAVGASIKMEDGSVFEGSNQENVSYPCGLCAERTALFYAANDRPKVSVKVLAIAAKSGGTFLEKPITPCGLCRQALLEYETRFKKDIKVLLYGTKGVYRLNSVASLLPLQFDSL